MPKLPKAKIVKLQIDELAAVDEGAQDAQGTVLLKRKDGLAPVRKDTWTTSYKDSLPDSAFLYIEAGGKKDGDGKTTPRSLRHFPVKDLNGKVDLEHARAAAQEAPKSSLPADVVHKVQIQAEKLVAKVHKMNKQIVSDLKKRGILTALQKRGMLTTATDGHTHLLDDGDGAASGCTDGASMTMGDPYGTGYHWHPWARSSDGTIMIGEAAGHTHELLTPDELQQILDAEDADVDEEDTAIVKARGKSTPSPAVKHAANTTEGIMPTEHEIKIADLTKRNATLEKLAELPDAHRAHYKTLGSEAGASFLAKSHVDRDVEIAKALENDPVEVEIEGVQYRKSAGAATIALAKRSKAQEVELAKAKAEADQVKLEKRARDTMPGLKAELPIATRMLKALDREFTDPKEHEQAVGVLKFASSLAVEAGAPKGFDAGDVAEAGALSGASGDPLTEWNAEVKKFAEKNAIKDDGTALVKFLGTTEGKIAKRKYDESRAYSAKK